ncbi:hypothetical protein PC123_g10625 [Phytophthora cactorum]|nr:hypothetical protein PC123_g10625 [Phytophthora cactorum]
MDFVFDLPKDKAGNTGIVGFENRLSKMAHLAVVPDTIDGEGTALLFLDRGFRQHGLPEATVSDRDPRFITKFWKSPYQVLGTLLNISTANHPQTDGQTERVNRVVGDILRRVCAEARRRWSEVLPLVEFALNNAVHSSTGFTPFYVNGMANPRVPQTPPSRGSGLPGGGIADRLADIIPVAGRKNVDAFASLGLSILRRQVRDAMAESQELQKEYGDVLGRGNVERFEVGGLVLLNAKNLPTPAVSAVVNTKLRSRFIEPFKVVAKKGLAYTFNLPKKMGTHTVFYLGLLKPYQDPAQLSVEALAPGRHVTAGRQRVVEPQDAERTAEDAVTRQADRAVEQLDAPRLRPRPDSLEEADRLAGPSPQHDSEPLAGTRPRPPAAAYHRDLPPGGERRRSRRGRTRRLSEDGVPEGTSRCDSRSECPAEAQPPPAVLDERGDIHISRGTPCGAASSPGRTQYLVKWRGYPFSQNSWELEVPLREDCPNVVYAYDLAHPLPTHHQG